MKLNRLNSQAVFSYPEISKFFPSIFPLNYGKFAEKTESTSKASAKRVLFTFHGEVCLMYEDVLLPEQCWLYDMKGAD